MSNFMIIRSQEDLMHHGTKGMRWGVRRYQNKDGSLTDLGKRRLGYGDGDRSPEQTRGNVHDLVAKDYQKISSAQRSSSEASTRAANIANRSAANAKQKAMNRIGVSSMSDSDLQRAINRMNLERTYKSLTSENVGAGRRRVSSYLQTTGDLLAIGSSAASIMVAIHELKK